MVASNGRPATVECQSQPGSRDWGERRRRPAALGTCAPGVQPGERTNPERHPCSPRDRNDERRPLPGVADAANGASFAGSLIGCTGGPGGPADRSVDPRISLKSTAGADSPRSTSRLGPVPLRFDRPHARIAPVGPRPRSRSITDRPVPTAACRICSLEAVSSARAPAPRSPEPARTGSGAIMPRRRARRGRIEAECGGLLNR